MATLEEDKIRITDELQKLTQQFAMLEQTRQQILEEIIKRKGMLEYINNLNGTNPS